MVETLYNSTVEEDGDRQSGVKRVAEGGQGSTWTVTPLDGMVGWGNCWIGSANFMSTHVYE